MKNYMKESLIHLLFAKFSKVPVSYLTKALSHKLAISREDEACSFCIDGILKILN